MSLLALNSVYNIKKGNDRYLWSRGKTFTPCTARTIIFQRKISLLFNSVYLVFFNTFVFSIASLFAVRYLWDVCNEDKCCVVTHHAAHARGAWLVYVHTYCVPTATLNQNKRSRLLYLGDTKLIIDSSKLCLPSPHEFPRYIFC